MRVQERVCVAFTVEVVEVLAHGADGCEVEASGGKFLSHVVVGDGQQARVLLCFFADGDFHFEGFRHVGDVDGAANDVDCR